MLAGRLQQSRLASAGVDALSEQARRIASELDAWSELPAGFHGLDPVEPSENRAAHCYSKLVTALQRRELDEAKAWSKELRWCLFRLADLHRWLNLLYENTLTALDFQAKCSKHFSERDQLYASTAYDPNSSLSRFAGGSTILYGEHNLYEVERQAESFFGLAGKELLGARENTPLEAAYAMPPRLRATFLFVHAELPPKARTALARAATNAFDRSCLENQLFRLSMAGALDPAIAAVKQLFRVKRDAGASELLDVLFYRGAGYFCGLEWGDRFDARLIESARGLGRVGRRMLERAQAQTLRRYDPKAYVGGTLTLRSALDTRAFDCIRATDMIGAIYRNAGGVGFVELRECRGGHSHTVAGRLEADGSVFSVDGLAPGKSGNRIWPKSYFRSRTEHAVEVHARGLDTSVWMAGYIVQGDSAGMRIDATLPYLSGGRTAREQKVFAGPYPARTPKK